MVALVKLICMGDRETTTSDMPLLLGVPLRD
jgi:hypothetical protein